VIEKPQDDYLITPAIGKWAKRKHNLVKTYASLFATAMLQKWDNRVFIDLFAGPGQARIKHTRKLVYTSPILVMQISDPFDKYIFCEMDPGCIDALKRRVNSLFPKANVEYVPGDSNENVDRIIGAIPAPSKSHTVLSFCFVDPFSMSNLRFETIRSLARMYIDFLVLIPAYMDAHRNLTRYSKKSNQTVENFLGLDDWRVLWNASKPGTKFGAFIADQFGLQMKSLGYSYQGLPDTVLVREPQRNIPLYRLAYFSRHPLGIRFWQKAKKSTRSQLTLFE